MIYHKNQFSMANCSVIAVANCFYLKTGKHIELDLLKKLSIWSGAEHGAAIRTGKLVELLGMKGRALGSFIKDEYGDIFPLYGSIYDPKHGLHSVTITEMIENKIRVYNCSETDDDNLIAVDDYMKMVTGSPNIGDINYRSANYFYYFEVTDDIDLHGIECCVDEELDCRDG